MPSWPATSDLTQAVQHAFGDYFRSYVVRGGLPEPSPTLTIQVPFLTAYISDPQRPGQQVGIYETQPRAWTVSGMTPCWVIARARVAETPVGWQGVPGTAYCWQSAPSRPPLPPSCVWLAQLTLTGSAVTAVQDLRPSNPLSPTVVVTDPIYGVMADGVTDDGPALTKAFAALPEGGQLVFPPGTYAIGTTVDCLLPEHTTVRAQGCTFVATAEVVMFRLNSAADFSSAAASSASTRRFVTWEGGHYRCTAATQTQSKAFEGHMFRHLTLRQMRIEGFWRAVEVVGKDTYLFEDLYFFNNRYGIVVPAGLVQETGDVTLAIQVHQCHFSLASAVCGIAFLDRTTDSYIRGCSFNGLHATDGLASILVRDAAVYYAQGVNIIANHFEQLPAGKAFIWCQDTAEQGCYVVRIEGNNFSSAAVGWTAIRLERTRGVTVKANMVRAAVGDTTSVVMNADALCTRVEFSQSNFPANFSADRMLSGAMPRYELAFIPEVLTTPTMYALEITGYNGTTFNTPVTATIAMATAWDGWDLLRLTPPKGYWMALILSDTGSSVGSGAVALATVGQLDPPLSVTRLRALVSNVAAGTSVTVHGYVPADSAGNVEIAITPITVATVTVRVMAVHQ